MPKPYFYPLYTTWYPKQFKKVKYILTIRQETNTIVNSRLRFDLRTLSPKKCDCTLKRVYDSTSVEYIFQTFIHMIGNWNRKSKKMQQQNSNTIKN